MWYGGFLWDNQIALMSKLRRNRQNKISRKKVSITKLSMTVIKLSLYFCCAYVLTQQLHNYTDNHQNRTIKYSFAKLLEKWSQLSNVDQWKNDGLFKDFRVYRQLTMFVPCRINLISHFSYKWNTIKICWKFYIITFRVQMKVIPIWVTSTMWSRNPYHMERLLFEVTTVISNFCDYIKIGKNIDEFGQV